MLINTIPQSTQFKSYGLPFRMAPLEVYYMSLRSLTYGVTDLKDISSGMIPQNLGPNYDLFLNCFNDVLLPKLDYQSSKLLCQFACTYTTFLHHGVIKSMFMNDHETFYSTEVALYPQSVNYLMDCPMKKESITDYYYWMSLYYSILALGCSFGCDELKSSLPYSDEELNMFPQVFLQVSLDAAMRAGALQKPDIRFVQIYCVMTTFLHAIGRAQLHAQLLAASFQQLSQKIDHSAYYTTATINK
ncbi:unnamed protein product [Ambrosiozyma monospora]|uniref:Unnamed protein product n=1 Tax=Ambrosiozyma monospora TaxID=43982 RepID=A0ACB5U910_AMBMO|nr:unnamed protein product [Ambrosiozyma monospora]